MAKSRVAGGGGRLLLTLFLLLFLMISGGVIMRRTIGIAAARDQLVLDGRRSALMSERLLLEGDARAASSRARLQPIAEQNLLMHVPADTQVIILQRSRHEST